MLLVTHSQCVDTSFLASLFFFSLLSITQQIIAPIKQTILKGNKQAKAKMSVPIMQTKPNLDHVFSADVITDSYLAISGLNDFPQSWQTPTLLRNIVGGVMWIFSDLQRGHLTFQSFLFSSIVHSHFASVTVKICFSASR